MAYTNLIGNLNNSLESITTFKEDINHYLSIFSARLTVEIKQ